MNVYNFKEIEKCYVFGTIRSIDGFIKKVTSNISNFKKEEHPKEIERQRRLVYGDGEMPMYLSDTFSSDGYTSSAFNHSVIIVSGSCGIGSKSKTYYEETFGKLDKVLGDNNCFILFVRGNNDNPSIFNNREIDFEHVKTIPDYSVVLTKTFNCLCIGGSVSMDKEWKLAQEKLGGKKLYWENEAPIYDKEQLKEILDTYDINCVITNTCPSFAYPTPSQYKKNKWLCHDKNVAYNCYKERGIMDEIYKQIMDSDSKLYVWAYGGFGRVNREKVNDIFSISLNDYDYEALHLSMKPLLITDTAEQASLGDMLQVVKTPDYFVGVDYETLGINQTELRESQIFHVNSTEANQVRVSQDLPPNGITLEDIENALIRINHG